jgi:peptidoglycan/xylan/chitin deacetylase (PgdA/CDA1 family)
MCDFYVRASKISGAVILMYHSVATAERRGFQDPAIAMPASVFTAQMSFLSRRRRVISLNALAEMLAMGKHPEPGTVVITFDDGYLDNYQVAAPILTRHGLPATVFLATGYIERTENMWIDVIYVVFKGRTRHYLELEGAAFDLNQPKQLDQAYASATGALLRARMDSRAGLLSSIREQLRPRHEERRLMMGWSEVQALCERHPNISVGSHTREHLDLSALRDDEVVEELSAAHEDIRRELGIDVVHFTFPYGRDNAQARSWLQSNGYLSASLTEPMSLVQRNSNPFALTRLAAQQDPSWARFAYHTSGAHPSLSRALLLGQA